MDINQNGKFVVGVSTGHVGIGTVYNGENKPNTDKIDLKKIDGLRRECWEKRFYSFGTTKIFEKRAADLNKKRRLITFFGLVPILTVGAFILSFTTESIFIKVILIPIALSAIILQTILSLWSIIARWDERYTYAIGAIKGNARLTSTFDNFAKYPVEILEHDIEKFREEYTKQETEDLTQDITNEEKRFAMRSALFQYRSRCPTCGEIPNSMVPKNCDACGNYREKLKWL